MTIILCLGLVSPTLCAADDARYERQFSRSKADIEKLLRGLQTPVGSRLPILDGFVIPGLQPLDRYGRAYYQYSFDILALNQTECRVRATAKITAWYEDPDPAKSSYQLLKSNGRLEQDILDRLTEAVDGSRNAVTPRAASQNAGTALPKAAPSNAPRPDSPRPMDAAAATAAAVFKLPAPLRSLPSRQDSLTPTAPRSAEEQHAQELQRQARSLEEILHNQAYPNNLLVVKHSRTPVAAKPSAAADILMLADEGDEFQVLDRLGSWVHIQVSGIARGWLQSGDVELPDSLKGTATQPTPIAPSAKESSAREPFVLDREETTTFPGDWAALNGKSVRVVWVRPSEVGQASNARTRLVYARSLYRATFSQLVESSPDAAGIVIVFDSADGGMIAATTGTLNNWETGTLSDTEFWKQCWFDPPEAFIR